QAPEDFHQQFIAATMSGPRSVTVAISNTGHTEQTLTVARAARKAGGTVISLTGRVSPLSEIADIGVALRRSPAHSEAIRRMKSELAAMRHAEGDATEADS
ncbi:MAG: transcriptional regulator, partial [Microbacterium sp.]|nr:transcriptional regulator [Microbacterium sp.]